MSVPMMWHHPEAMGSYHVNRERVVPAASWFADAGVAPTYTACCTGFHVVETFPRVGRPFRSLTRNAQNKNTLATGV